MAVTAVSEGRTIFAKKEILKIEIVSHAIKQRICTLTIGFD
jgi:hypothetical protein